jgi:hypothetical protein
MTMKVILQVIPFLLVFSCGGQPAASLGDSPIKEIRCPSFLDQTGCIERAKRECGSERVTVLSVPPKDEVLGQGSTVPIEGAITHRIITVRCERQ